VAVEVEAAKPFRVVESQYARLAGERHGQENRSVRRGPDQRAQPDRLQQLALLAQQRVDHADGRDKRGDDREEQQQDAAEWCVHGV